VFARFLALALAATVLTATAIPSVANDRGQDLAVKSGGGAVAAGMLGGARFAAPGMTQGVLGPETQRRVAAIEILRPMGQPMRDR
jgi:hypothetical protein